MLLSDHLNVPYVTRYHASVKSESRLRRYGLPKTYVCVHGTVEYHHEGICIFPVLSKTSMSR